MSLSDELKAAAPERVSPMDDWIARWFQSLDDDDRATWIEWLNDPSRSAVAMWRVIQRKDFPFSCSGFEKWVRRQRDARQ